MNCDAAYIIKNYEYSRCPRLPRRFQSLVSLHNHSRHSVENLASLQRVMDRGFMAPLRAIVRRAFGLNHVPDLTYADLHYSPPYSPEDVLRMETESACTLGIDAVLLAITDHDEIAGSMELRQCRPAEAERIAPGEELSLRFEGHVFHLGITGLAEEAGEIHAALQWAARDGRLDDLFEMLRASGSLVVLNHPLIPWGGVDSETGDLPLKLLARYGWAIHALEYNGMRSREENDRVLQLARHVGKPVVGGGDSHLLLASSTLCGSQAKTYADFMEEVKSGSAVPVIKRDYFAPLGWKLFLRVLHFMSQYRAIASFRGERVAKMLAGRTVLLDPVGRLAQAFLRLALGRGFAR